MSITLLAVVVALVLGHIAPVLVTLRRFGWYTQWLALLARAVPTAGLMRLRYGVVLALLPPLLLVLLLQWWLRLPLLGLLGVLFAVVVLVYSWGPRDLDVDVEAVLDAYDSSARAAALQQLWPDGEPARGDAAALVPAVFRSALQRWFAVLFWFLLLGPVGALLYRLVALAAVGPQQQVLAADSVLGARRLQVLLEWPVAQLMTLALALVGHFDVVRAAWQRGGGAQAQLQTGFLDEAARASVRSELADEADDYLQEGRVPVLGELPELRDAMSLVWRVLLVWLAVLALFVIGGWVN